MTKLIATASAAALDSSSNFLRSYTGFPDVSSGLAHRTLLRGGITIPDSFGVSEEPSGSQFFRRAPDLAAYGYIIEPGKPGVERLWLEGIEHLRGREAFPGDGNSFVHNPDELLGIWAGILALSPPQNEQVEWLIDLVRRGLNAGKFRTPISQLSAELITGQYKNTGPEIVSNLDLDARSLLSTGALLIAFAEPWQDYASELQKLFVPLLLSEKIVISTAAEAAAALVLTDRAINQVVLGIDGKQNVPDFIVALCRRFHLLAIQLQKRHSSRPGFDIKDEYDVQDLLHSILKLHFDDIRAEDVSPSYAGNTSRVDFHLPRERLVVEVKMTRRNLGQKEVAKQLIEDVARYTKLETVDTLVCLVYDPSGFCDTPTALESDLEDSATRLRVRVVVCPRGI